MRFTVEFQTTPLTVDQDGAVRIANSRVTLDTVIGAFRLGASPEEIVNRYPSVRLADVYFVIGYYLRHRTEMDNYLKEREAIRSEIRQENEAKFPSLGLRERLLARRCE